MEKRSQVVSMDLVLGFIIYMLAISVFFYFIGDSSMFSKGSSIKLKAEYIFSRLDNLGNDRIDFLDGYRVSTPKFERFKNIAYDADDSNNDGLIDTKILAICGQDDGDCDDDHYPDIDELRLGTPIDGGGSPSDIEDSGSGIVGDGLDDYWESQNSGTDANSFDYAYENLDEDSVLDEPSDSCYGSLTATQFCNEMSCQAACCPDESYFLTGQYDEDVNNNGELDGDSLPANTGKLLDGQSSKCNIFGYVDFSSCERCIPNAWAYQRDIATGDFDHDGVNDVDEINIFDTISYDLTPGHPDETLINGIYYPAGALMTMEELGLTDFSSPDDDDDLPTKWEELYGFDTTYDCGSQDYPQTYDSCKYGDPDNDWLSNWEELKYGTDPTSWDSDGDGVSDFYEEIKPFGHDLREIILGDNDFDDIDVCLYIEDRDGNIVQHFGRGIDPDNKICFDAGCTQVCGDSSSPTEKPFCKTAPFREARPYSKPVLYEDQMANLKILVCSR